MGVVLEGEATRVYVCSPMPIATRIPSAGQTAADCTLPSSGLLHTERFYSNRAYFLIDKSGVIRWAYVEETPGTRRENAEILAEIAKLS